MHDAISLASEISRCAAVSVRHRGNAETDPAYRDLWIASSDRHRARYRTLADTARRRPDPEMARALDLFGHGSVLD
ncbi:hypothetical protein ACQP2U_43565 (plasmid) [Nocardia sp. CA-084685]|uniref:hypothetical protein n=1 Tax=Nocardia sp. CA-084685 TaxID=3239970 RepID=UPI003D992FB8